MQELSFILGHKGGSGLVDLTDKRGHSGKLDTLYQFIFSDTHHYYHHLAGDQPGFPSIAFLTSVES
jgi:hypothetical protein